MYLLEIANSKSYVLDDSGGAFVDSMGRPVPSFDPHNPGSALATAEVDAAAIAKAATTQFDRQGSPAAAARPGSTPNAASNNTPKPASPSVVGPPAAAAPPPPG